MYLHTLSVENNRAQRAAHVSFDATTVLVDENDCGKDEILLANRADSLGTRWAHVAVWVYMDPAKRARTGGGP
jgi:hypothetical protein